MYTDIHKKIAIYIRDHRGCTITEVQKGLGNLRSRTRVSDMIAALERDGVIRSFANPPAGRFLAGHRTFKGGMIPRALVVQDRDHPIFGDSDAN